MKVYKKTIIVPKLRAKVVQELLDMEAPVDLHELKYPAQSCIHTETAQFENGYEADIKVCTSTDDFFMDAVLFNSYGSEVSVLDVSFEFLGRYEFEQDGNTYVVEIEESDDLVENT